MSLSFEFNKDYKAAKVNDYVLQVECAGSYFNYDFASRIMFAWGAGSGSYGITPFSQLDREVLITMRDKLIEIGGKPPELPDEPASPQLQPRKFNL
jgi:hypothetical protein